VIAIPLPPHASIPIPTPPPLWSRDHPAAVDTECYPNYWLLKIRPVGGQTITFRLFEHQCFSPTQAAQIRDLLDHFLVISFNGEGYDQWTISRALMFGTPADLKVVNDQIIVEKLKGWTLGLGDWRIRNHIDLMNVTPGAGSQKAYAGRIHAKTMRDLPYNPNMPLNAAQIAEVELYCDNDLDVLLHLWRECAPLVKIREKLTARYGIDLRSKSDAQVAEAVLKKRCENALGRRLYKPETPDLRPLKFRCPDFISFVTPELQHALKIVCESTFFLGESGDVLTPPAMQKLTINLGVNSFKIGIGGLHSQEKSITHRSDEAGDLIDIDVESYYPSLILNSGEYPPALGPQFRIEYAGIKGERVDAKALQKQLEKDGHKGTPQWEDAHAENEGGKVGINGTFGKTGNIWSILFGPSLLLQTTLTGQLSLCMLIDWMVCYGIPVVSANTDGIVIKCPKGKFDTAKALIAEWERRTSLKMERTEYRSIHSHSVNSYFAVKTDGTVKRKGEYAKASLIDKVSPDVEVCSDAVARFLSEGYPMELHVLGERDIRKFITVQKVDGGGIKMWGEAPLGTERAADMVPRLEARGWIQEKRGRWVFPCGHPGEPMSTRDAYAASFPPQRSEYLGKHVRWYYAVNSPGAIVYATRNAKVSLSYGAKPCMTLPDELPGDIDYAWYMAKCRSILEDIGWRP